MFEKPFLVGAATAAHQVEGNNLHSDYWIMEHLKHSDFVEPSGGACGHYDRYAEDIALLARAGCNAYRFGIEWARIEPREGHFDEKEIEHYRQVLLCCKEHGITPIVTLHHFSSPAWLISQGGWGTEYVVYAFARYVRKVVQELGELTPYICTINEANMGFQLNKIAADMMKAGKKEGGVQVGTNGGLDLKTIVLGMFEQGKVFGCSPFGVNTFLKPRKQEQEGIVMRAHRAAVGAVKALRPEIKTGLTLSLFDYQPVVGGEAAAEQLWREDFGFYLPYFQNDDFLGVQNYSRKIVDANGAREPAEGVSITQMGYEDYPASIGHVLQKVAKDYHGELIVTENGIATSDDARRCQFIQEAAVGIKETIDRGVPVKGYLHWSLLDNFEWQAGYGKTFGLIAVDRKTRKRYPKDSLNVLGGLLEWDGSEPRVGVTPASRPDYEKEHRELVRRLAPECTVLLRSNGDFPLKETGKLALYGSGARHTVMGGTGSGEVNTRTFVTVEQGLTDAGFTITTGAWLDGYDQVLEEARAEFIEVIKARAKQKHTLAVMEGMGAVMAEPEYELPLEGEGDTAVYVLSRVSGEGNDREAIPGDILLSKTELRDILTLQKQYRKFLLVLNVGGPVDLSLLDGVENILVLSQLGMDTGNVLADLITGKAYPSGKLTTTWSAFEDYAAIGDFGEENDTAYREGVYVGYRYFDSVGKKALFPFGYGKSYTTFSITPGGVSADGEEISVTATVRNTGGFPGKEVAQLYVSVPGRKLDSPYQVLAAWQKTRELAPGGEETITLRFKLSDLASYDSKDGQYFLEGGDYILRLGSSSADTVICGVARLDGDAVTRQVRNVCGDSGFEDWKPETKRETEIPDGVMVVEISAAFIQTETVNYDRAPKIAPAVKRLTNEQLAYINVGAFNPKAGPLGIIGNASTSVAGAAGETTGILKDRGLPVLVMADGPAGLRLSREYTMNEKGNVQSLGEGMPESILEFLSPIQASALRLISGKKPKKSAKVYEQYATAIPIGTAVAQSWNLELAEACGDMVGSEMERFGVHLWLAPALNIHRDIRCGRNFEYFSEDPLISGRFAAAITRGVQRHPSCGTTIKHYAANNQETNRYNNSSRVSERAMREIYLKGFEICVRESQPYALMTSYNLLNGLHTSESRGLAEDILRCEWGFTGLVMTDWIVATGVLSKNTLYPAPKASKIAAAGGNLVMPGNQGDWKDILTAVREGRLRREQLEINATKVFEIADRLTR